MKPGIFQFSQNEFQIKVTKFKTSLNELLSELEHLQLKQNIQFVTFWPVRVSSLSSCPVGFFSQFAL